MKRYDLIMHMHPRELATFIEGIVEIPCEDSMGPCARYSRCAGCYWTWLNAEIGVHWCTNCKHYEKWGKCKNKDCPNYDSVKDYNDTCDAWEPADWWSEPTPKKICRTCGHHDDAIGKCLCGDENIIPPPVGNDGEAPCPGWEPKKDIETSGKRSVRTW